jgi:hypothetical protein
MVVLVELCAGSAALTRYFFNIPPLLGFMGAKDRYATAIVSCAKIEKPDVVVLNDLGFWGHIWEALISSPARLAVADLVESWEKEDARTLFYHLRGSLLCAQNLVEAAASRICLLSATYGGGEVGGFKGKHKLRPNVDGFIPSRKTLVKRLRDSCWIDLPTTYVLKQKAEDVAVPEKATVYIDPPYHNLTGYLNSFARKNVIETAKRCVEKGCKVLVSEAEPVRELVEQGWESAKLESSGRQCRKNTKCQEFLTWKTPKDYL